MARGRSGKVVPGDVRRRGAGGSLRGSGAPCVGREGQRRAAPGPGAENGVEKVERR